MTVKVRIDFFERNPIIKITKQEERNMNKMEKILNNLEKVTKKKEQAEHQIRLLNKQKNEVKRKSDTKRKIEKGGVFEKFEREITGMQERTTSDEVYVFLDLVFSDEKNREKLREITEKKIQSLETESQEILNLNQEKEERKDRAKEGDPKEDDSLNPEYRTI